MAYKTDAVKRLRMLCNTILDEREEAKSRMITKVGELTFQMNILVFVVASTLLVAAVAFVRILQAGP